jgi:MSHA biogenesis protein MshP
MNSIKRQRGLSLATALFVITVMAVLAAMIFQLVRSNAETTGEEVNLIRSFYAAQTGIQFGLNEIFPPDGVPATTCTVPMTTYPQFVLEVEGLEACTADVTRLTTRSRVSALAER